MIALRVFAARVVAGDDHLVGERARDAAHQRALAAVAVAAAAEHAHELAVRVPRGRCSRRHELAQRAQHLLERVGRVRVVDDDERLRAAAVALDAPGHRLHCASAATASSSAMPLASSTPSVAEQVGGVEAPDERGFRLRRRPTASPRRTRGRRRPCAGCGRRAAARAGRAARRQRALEAVAEHLRPRAARVGATSARAERVVDVEHRALRAPASGRAAPSRRRSCHRAVVVEVVAREVGEERDVELDAGHAVLVEAVRRHFHATACAPLPHEVAQRLLQHTRVGRGVARAARACPASRCRACR